MARGTKIITFLAPKVITFSAIVLVIRAGVSDKLGGKPCN